MREILFRGKRINGKGWVYGDLITTHPRHIINNNHTIIEGGCIYHEVDPSTVGQFTGLTDKNGTRIFEGDVIHVKEWVQLKVRKEYTTDVIWEDSAFVIKTGREDYDAFAGILSNPFNSVPSCEVQIIGNIHENTEK